MAVAVVLITGNPGSGKTELAHELSHLGFSAVDTDEIAHWESADGRPADPPAEVTHEFLQGHRWVWGRARVAAVVAEHGPEQGHLFLCGIAIDQEELFDLFEVVFLLSIDEQTQVDRLDAPSNADRNAAQRRQIIEGRPVFEQRMRAAGAVVLDGSTPTPMLAARVLAEVDRRFPPAAAVGRSGSPAREAPAAAFLAGRVIQRREVLHGQVWMEHSVTVVDDRGGVLAVLLEPGSVFVFAEHPFGPHPWSAHPAWSGPTVLQLHRDSDPYSVWKFFTDGVFTHWYVNVEAPVVRRPDGTGGGGFDTADHGIDIVVPADGSPWRWKDFGDPEAMAAAGRITAAEAQLIHVAADEVAARLDAGDRWWEPWDTWQPGDPAPR